MISSPPRRVGLDAEFRPYAFRKVLRYRPFNCGVYQFPDNLSFPDVVIPNRTRITSPRKRAHKLQDRSPLTTQLRFQHVSAVGCRVGIGFVPFDPRSHLKQVPYGDPLISAPSECWEIFCYGIAQALDVAIFNRDANKSGTDDLTIDIDIHRVVSILPNSYRSRAIFPSLITSNRLRDLVTCNRRCRISCLRKRTRHLSAGCRSWEADRREFRVLQSASETIDLCCGKSEPECRDTRPHHKLDAPYRFLLGASRIAVALDQQQLLRQAQWRSPVKAPASRPNSETSFVSDLPVGISFDFRSSVLDRWDRSSPSLIKANECRAKRANPSHGSTTRDTAAKLTH
jgi:hypothetical protein